MPGSKVLSEVDWDDAESLVGLVFEAKAHKRGIANVVGTWGRVRSVKDKGSKERTTKFVVRFYVDKANAEAASNDLKEETLTLRQLKANSGADESEEEGEGEGEEEEGEEEEGEGEG